jgi:hypothetical protein
MRRLLKFGCLGLLGFFVFLVILGALLPKSDRGTSTASAPSPATGRAPAPVAPPPPVIEDAETETAEEPESGAIEVPPGTCTDSQGNERPSGHWLCRAVRGGQPEAAAEAPPPPAAPAPAVSKPAPKPAPSGGSGPPPIQLTGRGQQLTQTFTLQPGLVVASLAHNGSRNFIAALHTSEGARVEALVNDIGPFDGSKAFGLRTGGSYAINVQADGGWSIQLRQPAAVAETAAKAFTGTGAKATSLFELGTGLRRFTLKH